MKFIFKNQYFKRNQFCPIILQLLFSMSANSVKLVHLLISFYLEPFNWVLLSRAEISLPVFRIILEYTHHIYSFHCRGLCDNCSQTETTNTYETNDTFLHIPLGGSSIYKYNITLQSKTNGMLSETVDLIIFTPVTSEFNCVDCRVERVRINSSTKIVTCEVSLCII